MKTSSRGAALCTLGLALTAGAVAAQTADYPRVTWEEEVRLAMSAGPLSVSSDADVYVMGRSGFEHAIRGTNGWACLVVRAAASRSQLAPHCLNPQAVKSVLPAFLHEGQLQARGLGAAEINAELQSMWESGALELPSGPAYAYMMSEGQRLGPSAGNFHPHFMLYVPYVTNADIGGDPANMQFPFVGPYENHPLSTVVVLTEHFVSPESVVVPKR